MATTLVGAGTTDNNAEVTSGNTLEVQTMGTANTTQVDNGGMLLVDAGGTENNATILAGGTETVNGTINSSNVPTSSGMSSGDLDYGTINVGNGGIVSNVTIENGGAVNLTIKTAAVNGATVLTGGLLTINGNAPANNVTLQGGTLELISPKADTANTQPGQPTATGSLTFATGSSSRLMIDVPQTGTGGTTFAQTISGFAPGNAINLKFITGGAMVTQTASGTSTNVTVSGTGGSETFTFLNTTPGQFTTANDANGGTNLIEAAACYVAGTLIATTRGAVAIETLQIGDLVVTASGAHRPIKWLGHRTIDCRRHPRPSDVLPMRISAHTFGLNRPARDLLVSPGHAICVDVAGDTILIPAVALADGLMIVRAVVDTVTYWHLELDSHDIVLAENLPSESYLEMGNRGFFVEGRVLALAAAPDARPLTHADFCRPFHVEGPIVAAVRARLAASAVHLERMVRVG